MCKSIFSLVVVLTILSGNVTSSFHLRFSRRKTRTIINGQSVVLYHPEEAPVGTTFFCTGAMSFLSIYDTLIEALLEQNQLVVGIFSNVFSPSENNHEYRAEKIPQVFDALQENYPDLPETYNLVGHSVGGKISLLVAARYDTERVSTVIALDPVDQNPPVFTNINLFSSIDNNNNTAANLTLGKRPFHNENLTDSDATIVLTQSGIYDEPCNADMFNSAHNAAAIHFLNPDTIYIKHENSSHIAYTDLNPRFWRRLIPPGDSDANAFAKEDAVSLIQKFIS